VPCALDLDKMSKAPLYDALGWECIRLSCPLQWQTLRDLSWNIFVIKS